jgi:hypothetical protein
MPFKRPVNTKVLPTYAEGRGGGCVDVEGVDGVEEEEEEEEEAEDAAG